MNFNDYFSNLYDDGTEYTVEGVIVDHNYIVGDHYKETPVKGLKGIMYGNDECFDFDFYQILVAGNKVYKCYYNIPDDICGPDGSNDLGSIDYSHPDWMVDVTDKYED